MAEAADAFRKRAAAVERAYEKLTDKTPDGLWLSWPEVLALLSVLPPPDPPKPG